MSVQRKPLAGLYLVGFMASGKTTIGRAFARKIGWPFIDIDTEIEALERCAISQIFSERGERYFREVETEVLRHRVAQIEAGAPAVVVIFRHGSHRIAARVGCIVIGAVIHRGPVQEL